MDGRSGSGGANTVSLSESECSAGHPQSSDTSRRTLGLDESALSMVNRGQVDADECERLEQPSAEAGPP